MSRVLNTGYRVAEQLRREATRVTLRLERPATPCRRVLYEPYCIDLDCNRWRWYDVTHFEERRVLLGCNWFGCVVVLVLGLRREVEEAPGETDQRP